MFRIRVPGQSIFAKGKPVPIYWNGDPDCIVGVALLETGHAGVEAAIHLDDIFPAEVIEQAKGPEYWDVLREDDSVFVVALSLTREVVDT